MIFRITGVRITWVQLYNKLAEKLNKIVFLLYLLICDENLVERERESHFKVTPHIDIVCLLNFLVNDLFLNPDAFPGW